MYIDPARTADGDVTIAEPRPAESSERARLAELCLRCGSVRPWDAQWTRASIAMQRKLPMQYHQHLYYDPAKYGNKKWYSICGQCFRNIVEDLWITSVEVADAEAAIETLQIGPAVTHRASRPSPY